MGIAASESGLVGPSNFKTKYSIVELFSLSSVHPMNSPKEQSCLASSVPVDAGAMSFWRAFAEPLPKMETHLLEFMHEPLPCEHKGITSVIKQNLEGDDDKKDQKGMGKKDQKGMGKKDQKGKKAMSKKDQMSMSNKKDQKGMSKKDQKDMSKKDQSKKDQNKKDQKAMSKNEKHLGKKVKGKFEKQQAGNSDPKPTAMQFSSKGLKALYD